MLEIVIAIPFPPVGVLGTMYLIPFDKTFCQISIRKSCQLLGKWRMGWTGPAAGERVSVEGVPAILPGNLGGLCVERTCTSHAMRREDVKTARCFSSQNVCGSLYHRAPTHALMEGRPVIVTVRNLRIAEATSKIDTITTKYWTSGSLSFYGSTPHVGIRVTTLPG